LVWSGPTSPRESICAAIEIEESVTKRKHLGKKVGGKKKGKRSTGHFLQKKDWWEGKGWPSLQHRPPRLI